MVDSAPDQWAGQRDPVTGYSPIQNWLYSYNPSTREATAANAVVQDTRSITGKEPTPADASVALQYFLGGDPATIDRTSGDAFISATYLNAKATPIPANQSADNMDNAASGIFATSTPGGTPGSFASKFSFGGAPSDSAAPPSDNSLLLVGLGVAAVLYFFVFKHG